MTTSLGLRGQTVASLQAFKKRNDDVRRKVQALSEQSTEVDFAHYRSVLKNTAVIDEIEKRFTAFKPATYDVSRQLKAIEAFEVEAVRNAVATKETVDLELKDLEKTLKNIDEARPFEDLTVDDVAAAESSIDEKTSSLVSKGRWSVPGYKVRYTLSNPRRMLHTVVYSLDFFKELILSLHSLAHTDNPTGEVRRPGPGISDYSQLLLYPRIRLRFPLSSSYVYSSSSRGDSGEKMILEKIHILLTKTKRLESGLEKAFADVSLPLPLPLCVHISSSPLPSTCFTFNQTTFAYNRTEQTCPPFMSLIAMSFTPFIYIETFAVNTPQHMPLFHTNTIGL